MIFALMAFALASESSVPAPIITTPVPVIITPFPIDRVRLLEGLSAEGRAVLKAEMEAERERVASDALKLRVAQLAVQGASLRRPLELDALRTALEARDKVQADARQARTRAAITFLQRLSKPDRDIVAGVIPGIADRPLPPSRLVPRN